MESKTEEVIRKGPWKAEEDEVLINHVNKYGPRDWSSIRSKGLLQRTGKSCRLRWVNKLRPNLKNGCKFSTEEERVVIELQAQFGNKWARIARYLPGRTDNDVKNFWSSRQKRLARILHGSAGAQKSQRNKKEVQEVRVSQDVPSMEPQIMNHVLEEESSSSAQFCSLSCIGNPETIKMVAVSDLINQKLLHSENNHVQLDCLPKEKKSSLVLQTQTPFSEDLLPPNDLAFSSEGENIFPRFDDPDLYNYFGPGEAVEIGTEDLGTSFIEPLESHFPKECDVDSVNPDTLFDDFPAYMFDNIDLPPGSSKL